MHQCDPSWRWNGPAIPDRKPFFSDIQTAADGRIWVQVSQPGRLVTTDSKPTHDGGVPPVERWIEPVVYDVFEVDGRYLGSVHLPDETELMYMRGDQVWAVQRDENEVPYVVRYRISGNSAGN